MKMYKINYNRNLYTLQDIESGVSSTKLLGKMQSHSPQLLSYLLNGISKPKTVLKVLNWILVQDLHQEFPGLIFTT